MVYDKIHSNVGHQFICVYNAPAYTMHASNFWLSILVEASVQSTFRELQTNLDLYHGHNATCSTLKVIKGETEEIYGHPFMFFFSITQICSLMH